MSILKKAYHGLQRFFQRRSYLRQNITLAEKTEVSNTTFEEYAAVAHHAQVANSHIGKRTSIGRYSKIRDAEIGRYCSISWDVTIGAVNHPFHTVSTHAFPFRRQFGLVSSDTMLSHPTTKIGNDVWIGCGVIVLPGVSIGNGALIGAGAVVTHNIAPYEIVAGVPAKHVGYRFSEPLRARLQKSLWWQLPDEALHSHMACFQPEVDFEHDLALQQELFTLCDDYRGLNEKKT